MRLKTKFMLALAALTLLHGPVHAQISIAPTNAPSLAEYVAMAWDSSPDSTVVGYNLYFGTNSGIYMGKLDAGNSLTATLDITPRGVTYYFAAVAYDSNGEESPFSNEISYEVPNLIPQSPLGILPAGPLGYGTTSPLATTGGSGSGAITYTILSGPGYLGPDGSSLIVTAAAGTIVLQATKAADDVYLATSATNSISLTPASQTISFSTIPSVKETNVVTLSASASSGLPVSFSVSSGPGTVSGNQLSFSGPGTVTVVASQSGNSLYYAATSVPQTITVAAVVWPSITLSTNLIAMANTYGSTNQVLGTLDLHDTGEIAVSYTNTVAFGSNTKAWLQVAPANGSIPAFGTVTLTATADVTGLPAGTYYATNIISSVTATNSPVKWIAQLSVLPSAQASLVFKPATTQACGTTNLLSTTGGSGSGSFSYSVLSGPGLIVGGNQLVVTAGSGQILVQATKAGDTNYVAANVSATVTAGKGSQAITFPTIPPQKSTNIVTLVASSTAQLPVTYSVISGPGVISGSQLSFDGIGTVRVVASQAGNSDYFAATSVTNTFIVTTYLKAPGSFRILAR